MAMGAPYDVDVRDLLWRRRSRYEDELAAVPGAPLSPSLGGPGASVDVEAAWRAILEGAFARSQPGPADMPVLRRGQLGGDPARGEPARRFVGATWVEAGDGDAPSGVEHQLVWFPPVRGEDDQAGRALDEDPVAALPADWPLQLARSLAGAAPIGRIEPGPPADPGRWTDVGELARWRPAPPVPTSWTRDWRVVVPLVLLILSILLAILSRRRG